MKTLTYKKISRTINLFFVIAFFLTGLLINIFTIYHIKTRNDIDYKYGELNTKSLKHFLFNKNILINDDFKIYKYNPRKKYYTNITEDINNIIILNIFFLMIYFILFEYLKKSLKFFLIENEKEHVLDLKKFEDSLESKIILSIAENLHHEIKTPLISLRNALLEYNKIFEITLKALKDKNYKILEKIYFGKTDNLECATCPAKNLNNLNCEYFNYFKTSANYEIETLNEVIKSSIKTIFQVISVTKAMKSFKNQTEKISIYDVASQIPLLFNIIQKYKINCNIDEKLKHCYLNGLPSDILLNIFINHVKNSLEARGSNITFKFIDYVKENKNFIILEIIDNGHGVPDLIKDRIFEMHFSSKTKNKNSRGVGLYLTKNILNYFGGDDWLEHTSSNGTIFKLKIPVKECLLENKELK